MRTTCIPFLSSPSPLPSLVLFMWSGVSDKCYMIKELHCLRTPGLNRAFFVIASLPTDKHRKGWFFHTSLHSRILPKYNAHNNKKIEIYQTSHRKHIIVRFISTCCKTNNELVAWMRTSIHLTFFPAGWINSVPRAGGGIQHVGPATAMRPRDLTRTVIKPTGNVIVRWGERYACSGTLCHR